MKLASLIDIVEVANLLIDRLDFGSLLLGAMILRGFDLSIHLLLDQLAVLQLPQLVFVLTLHFRVCQLLEFGGA